MKKFAVCTMLILQSAIGTAIAADNCPPNGQTKTGGNPNVSWTSYMVRTPEGICVERTVKTRGRTFINWPAANMDKIFVNGNWSTKRCCFEDSTIKDADLEYGLIGSTLHTTVYQGDHETASSSSFSGTLISGGKRTRISVSAAVASASRKCKQSDGLGQISCDTITLENKDSPVLVRWTGDIKPEANTARKDEAQKTFLLGTGKTFVLTLPHDSDLSDAQVSVATADGQQKVSKKIPLKSYIVANQ